MADGNEIVAHAPDGTSHHFPAGTDPSVIDSTMKQYITQGAPQQQAPQQQKSITDYMNAGQSQGMLSKAWDWINKPIADTLLPQGSQTGDILKSTIFEKMFGEKYIPGVNDFDSKAQPGANFGQSPMRDALKTFLTGAAKDTASTAAGFTSPLALGTMGAGAVGELPGALGTAGKAVSRLASAGFAGKGASDVIGAGTENTPEAWQQRLQGGAMMSGGAAGAAASGVPKVGEIAQTVGREVMGVGPTTEAMKADAMSHAAAVKQHLVNVESVVEDQAKQAVQQPIQAIDAANPNGAFDKGNISDGVKEEVKDILKTPDAMGQLPASVRRMLVKEEAPSTTRALTSNELQTANIIQKEVLDKGGGISDAKSAMANLGYAPKQIEAILSTLSGGAEASTTAAWTAEQLRQFRSAVGRDLGRYETKGEVGAALNGVYNYLTGQLREAARNVSPDTETAFLKGNSQYKTWMDDFHRSPLKKVLNGQTTGDVLKGLTSEQVPAILQKYKNVGMDTQGLATEARRSKVGETIDRFSKPSKWDMVIGAIHPGYAAVRLGIPYLARHPAVLDWLAGKGMETPSEATPLSKIKAKQVSIRNQP